MEREDCGYYSCFVPEAEPGCLYKFRIASKGTHFEVNADPADPDSGLSYLYIDEEGHIRSEKGKPASAQSEKKANKKK